MYCHEIKTSEKTCFDYPFRSGQLLIVISSLALLIIGCVSLIVRSLDLTSTHTLLRRDISLCFCGTALILLAFSIIIQPWKRSEDPLYKQLKEAGIIFEQDQFEEKTEEVLTAEFCRLRSLSKSLEKQKEYYDTSFNQELDRFSNIKPYSSNRPVVSDLKYINASQIPSNHILTQGPLPSTINDFWTLIWESKAQVIVMATDLVENYKRKCEQYWPNEGIILYHDIQVEVKQIVNKNFYILRHFEIKKAGQPIRNIYQFHLTNWIDNGNFDVDKIDAVIQEVEKKEKKDAPTIVHCTAGVGRAGTFVACQIVRRIHIEAKRQKKSVQINLEQLVGYLRSYPYGRNHAVFDIKQYTMVYEYTKKLFSFSR